MIIKETLIKSSAYIAQSDFEFNLTKRCKQDGRSARRAWFIQWFLKFASPKLFVLEDENSGREFHVYLDDDGNIDVVYRIVDEGEDLSVDITEEWLYEFGEE